VQVWLNGTWVGRNDARISVFDAGFQHGVGLFETMRARAGRVFRIEDHLARLVESARVLRLSDSLRPVPLADAVQATIEANNLRDARVRLTITGGDLNLLQQSGARPHHDPTIVIVAQPPTQYPDELFKNGVRVRIADARVNPLDPFSGHKVLWYWPRLAALQAAGLVGAAEALHFSVSNHLASGCVSNVFLVRERKLLTPFARGEESAGALPAPVLPGITRKAIIEIAADQGLATERRPLTIEDVLSADEIFLTNSSWGVLPVVAVEGSTIGSGVPGERSRELAAGLEEVMRHAVA
jgi:branched-subunit amino acid aminotransferase/4-amino-4-deoxychorismate lyase